MKEEVRELVKDFIDASQVGLLEYLKLEGRIDDYILTFDRMLAALLSLVKNVYQDEILDIIEELHHETLQAVSTELNKREAKHLMEDLGWDEE